MEEEVLKKVQVLSDIVKSQTDRLDQAFKALDETIQRLAEAENLLETTEEALRKSLNESDRAVDDMATMVVSLQTQITKVEAIAETLQQAQQSNA